MCAPDHKGCSTFEKKKKKKKKGYSQKQPHSAKYLISSQAQRMDHQHHRHDFLWGLIYR